MTLFDSECVDEIEEGADAPSVVRAIPENPAEAGWPPTLAIELALRIAPVKEVCEAYFISREEWDRIRVNPAFIAELAGAAEMLRQDGMAFKARARLQSMELLKTGWVMIHDKSVPPNVRADLLKFTINAAGYGAEKSGGGGGVQAVGGVVNGFHININLGDGPPSMKLVQNLE